MKKIYELLAKDNGVKLIDHTKMVINFGLFIGEKVFNEYIVDNINNIKYNFKRDLSIALAIHDIGKCSNTFQCALKDKNNNVEIGVDGCECLSNKIKIRHNVFSWSFLLSRLRDLSEEQFRPIRSGVLYHHVVFDDVVDYSSESVFYENLSEDEIETFDVFYSTIKEYLINVFGFTYPNNFDLCESNHSLEINSEKLFKKIIKSNDNLINTKLSLIRACIILSDRLISSEKYDNDKILSNDTEYMEFIYDTFTKCNTIKDCINLCDCGYDMDRLVLQNDIVNNILSLNNHNVIGASAGLGKTLIGLLWFIKEKKKIIWITPRNVIANGTYDSIINELIQLKQTDVKVILYFGGEIVRANYSDANEDNLNECDILVTNIDSILNRYIKNNTAYNLLNLYTSNIIVDEYHELYSNEPLYPTFKMLMYTRTHYTNSKTLLLSATPLDLYDNDNIIKYYKTDKIPIHNGDMDVNIKILELNDINDLKIIDNDSFVITNTVEESQKLSMNSNNEHILIHSLFPNDIRCEIENNIYKFHGKNSNIKDRNLIMGTNIIGTGLDISAKNIYDFVITPESTIQRCCGRGGRFGEKGYENEINYYACVLNNSKNNDYMISKLFDLSLYKKWINMLSEYNGKTIKKKDLYNLYYKFHEENYNEIKKLHNKFFNEGLNYLKYFTPKQTNNNKKSDVKFITSNPSFRGTSNNIFVVAKNTSDGEWIKQPISIDLNKLFIEIDNDTNENRSERRKFILDKNNNFPKESILKYRYKLKNKLDYSFENISKLTKRSDNPMPLFNFVFDNKLGLIKKKNYNIFS